MDLWTQTVERYQRTVAQVKPRFLQSERTQGQGKPKTPSLPSQWDLLGPDSENEWGLGAGGGEGGLQSWGSLASLFRPQTCSTLKIGDEKGSKKDTTGGGNGGGAGGGKFLQNLLNPAKKSVSLGNPSDRTSWFNSGLSQHFSFYILNSCCSSFGGVCPLCT